MAIRSTTGRVLCESRECEEVFACISEAVAQYVEREFPGIREVLKLRASVGRQPFPPSEAPLSDPTLLVELLEDLFSDRTVLEVVLADSLSGIAGKPRALVRALLSGSGAELWRELTQDPAVLESCERPYGWRT